MYQRNCHGGGCCQHISNCISNVISNGMDVLLHVITVADVGDATSCTTFVGSMCAVAG
jgi:hypothetical protein